MTDRGFEKWIGILVVAGFILIVFGGLFGFKNAWALLSFNPRIIPFLISGLIMLWFGINEKKFGVLIFGIIVFVLFIKSFL